MAGTLTPKQAIFIAEYLVDGNATRAAIAAGYSRATAEVQGSRLLAKKVISDAIEYRRARRLVDLGITADRVLNEVAKLAFYDPGNLFDEKGDLLPIQNLDDVTRAAIAGVDVAEEKREEKVDKESGELQSRTLSWTKKIKLADKSRNLELLGKHLKLFTDVTEHKGRLTLEQLVCGDDGQGEDSGGEAAA